MRLETWNDVYTALHTESLHVANADATDPDSLLGMAARLLVSRKNGPDWELLRATIDAQVAAIDLVALADATRRSLKRSCQLDLDWRYAVGPMSMCDVLGFPELSVMRIPILVDQLARALAGEQPENTGIAAITELETLLNAEDPSRTSARLSLLMNSRIGLYLLFEATGRKPAHTDCRTHIRATLHHSPPVKEVKRVATESVTIGNHTIAAGSEVTLSLESAILSAPDQPNLAFGGGRRMCPAQVLAFTIGATVLDEIQN